MLKQKNKEGCNIFRKIEKDKIGKQILSLLLGMGLFFMVASVIFNKPIESLDELWNYNFARNMADGLVPYLDFNMLQMPLLPMIGALFLRLVTNEMIVLRLLGSILATGILWQFCKVLEKLEINKYLSILFTLGLFWLMQDYFCWDYNFAILFLVLTILRWELSDSLQEKKWKRELGIGILAGLCITFKQSTGMLIAVAVVGYKILEIHNKGELKQCCKTAGIRIVGVCIPVIVILGYILVKGAFTSFIDYAFLGIKTFSNSIPYSSLWEQSERVIKVLSILVPIGLLGLLINYLVYRIRNKLKESLLTAEKKFLTLFAYGIASFFVAFPISDKIHFLIGAVVGLIGIIYQIFRILQKGGSFLETKTEKYLKIEKFLSDFIQCASCLMLVFFLYKGIGGMTDYGKIAGDYQEFNHYRGIPISEGLASRIENVNTWIQKQEQEVYILDAEASLYHIPLNQYQKDYDMFLKGNLGGKGEQGQIEKLAKEENVLVLIRKEEISRNWQNPEEVRKYIINHYEKVGSIAIFDIYEIK